MTETAAREIRIAMVMNGGVSLAVWMAGVTHEFDLLRRASEGGPADDVPDYDREAWEHWRAAVADRRVVLDIVAGSSAGGVNGALLARAIAGAGGVDWPDDGRDRPFLRDLWERHAGLEPGELLPEDEPDPPSLLDGDRFAEVIDEALASIAERDGRRPDPGPVTLFVTATALGTADRPYRDAFGQQFLAADHRRLYRFRHDPKHRTYGLQGFARDALPDFAAYGAELARCIRASASYPVGFEPVRERGAMLGGTSPLRVLAAPGPEPAWLADGGILDNAPFGPVLDGISRRAPDAAVDRLLVYVVPARGSAALRRRRPGGSPRWSRVLGEAIALPREVDFRSDVDEIDELVHSADTEAQARQLFRSVVDGGPRGDAARELLAAAAALLPTYWRGHLAGRLREVRALASGAGGGDACDLGPQRPPDGTAAAPSPPPFGPDEDPLAAPWPWGVAAGERCLRLFARDLMARLGQGEPVTGAAVQVADELRDVEAVREALEAELAAVPLAEVVGDDERATRVVDKITEDLVVPDAMRRCLASAARAYTAAIGWTDGEEVDAARLALAVDVCARALQTGTPYQRTPPFRFLRLGPDVPAPVLDDAVRTVVDDRKLYGTRAGHFAAFGRQEWRTHDWLWGRLDAIAHLGRVLGMGPAWVRERQLAVLERDGRDPGGAQLRRQTAELLASDDDATILRELERSDGGRAALGTLTGRAARMVAGLADIRFVPEWGEVRLARWGLTRVLDQLRRGRERGDRTAGARTGGEK